jgi:hypothetical protein
MVKSDRFIVIIFIAAGVFLYTWSFRFENGEAVGLIAPTFFPRMIIGCLIACCLLLLIRKPHVAVSFPAPRAVFAGMALVVGYVLLMDRVGYLILTPLFLFLFSTLMGYRRRMLLLLFCIGGTLSAYLVFHSVLGVPLPMGIFES